MDSSVIQMPNVMPKASVKIDHIAATVVVRCACGNPKPILILFQPGAQRPGICEGCGIHHFVTRIGYDESSEQGEAIHLSTKARMPLIAPGSALRTT